MFTTLEQFFNDFRIKNDMVPSEVVLNKGPMRLKREIRELKSLSDITIGNDIPVWSANTRYEADEYVSYNNIIYRSTNDGNYNYTPDSHPAMWVRIEIVSLRRLLERIEVLEAKVG